MENKDSLDKLNNTQQEQEHNPNSSINLVVVVEEQQEEERNGSDVDQPPQSPRQPSSSTTTTTRTPFTNLSQVDADLALARTLQEQERAYMMLRINNEGSDYGSWEAGSYVLDDDDDEEDDEDEDFNDPHDETDDERIDGADDNDEDAFDVHAHAHAHGNDDLAGEENNPGIEFDPAVFSSDEAYARALQDAEDRDMAARLLALAGINDLEADEDEDIEDHGANSQDTWEELDPDELSYEELLALGDVVGTESRGLSANIIASLPSINYKSGSSQNGSSNDSCVICRLDYEDGETLTALSCKHSYHPECINNWLNINKVCPVCSAEVSVCGNS